MAACIQAWGNIKKKKAQKHMSCGFKVKVVGFFEGKWSNGRSAKANQRKIYFLRRGKIICKTRWGTTTLFWQPLTPTAYCVKTNTGAPQAFLRPKPEFSKRLDYWRSKLDFILTVQFIYFFFCHSTIVEKLFIAVLEQQLIRGKKNTRRFSTTDRGKKSLKRRQTEF